jgi:hypothetical protein
LALLPKLSTLNLLDRLCPNLLMEVLYVLGVFLLVLLVFEIGVMYLNSARNEAGFIFFPSKKEVAKSELVPCRIKSILLAVSCVDYENVVNKVFFFADLGCGKVNDAWADVDGSPVATDEIRVV